MSIIVAVFAALAIAFSAAPTAPVHVPQAVEVVAADSVLAMDAGATLGDYSIPYVEGQVLDYVETLTERPTANESATFVLESIDFPGHFHKYSVKVLSYA